MGTIIFGALKVRETRFAGLSLSAARVELRRREAA